MEQFSEKVMQALGEWKIADYLGSGQYGKVYEIQRTDFGTVYRAALKIITVPGSVEEIKEIKAAGMNDAEISNYFKSVVEDFVREFALMAKLKGHTNIVGYEDHQVIPADDGISWTILIRMELLTSLINYVSEKQMTRRDVIKLGIDLCKALELCQRVNIIHRDIKPANIFVSEMGEYKLGDFGVARIIEHTMSGRTGTDTYMAPEVYYEENYGPSADIYSLGIVMYRLLNGNRAPFLPLAPKPVTYRDNAEAFRKRINGEELPLPNQADGRLAEIVLKACAYRVADRYSSPVAMRKDLEAILYEESEAKEIYPEGDRVSDREGLRTNGTVSVKNFKRRSMQEQEKEVDFDVKEPKKEIQSDSRKIVCESKGVKEEHQNNLCSTMDEEFCGDHTIMVRRKRKETAKKETEAPDDAKKAEMEAPPIERIEKEMKPPMEEEVKNETNLQTSGEKKDIVRKTQKETQKLSGNDEEISEKRTGKKGKKKVFLVLPLAVVAAAGIAAVLYLGQDNKMAVIPDVCGVSFTDAESRLRDAGFTAEIKWEYSEEIFENDVIRQDIAGGEEQEKGSTVILTVSKGIEPIEVPNELSKKKEEAVEELERLGLVVTIKEEYSGSKVNTVIDQNMKAGSEAEAGDEITLIVSKMRPEVKGMFLGEALDVLKREGFDVTTIKGKNSKKAEFNTILGAKYQISDKKTAILSVNCIQVPDVTQMEKDEAITALTTSGFMEENISVKEEYNNDMKKGIVYEYQVQEDDWAALMDIPKKVKLSLGEKKVPKGAKISLTVSRGPEPKANAGSSSSSGAANYSTPTYAPPSTPAETPQKAPSTPKEDQGVVFSDENGRVIN